MGVQCVGYARLLVQLYLVPCYTACKQGLASQRRSVQALHCAFSILIRISVAVVAMRLVYWNDSSEFRWIAQLSSWQIPNTRKFSFWLVIYSMMGVQCVGYARLLVQLYLVPCYTACKQGLASQRRSVQALHCAFSILIHTCTYFIICQFVFKPTLFFYRYNSITLNRNSEGESLQVIQYPVS